MAVPPVAVSVWLLYATVSWALLRLLVMICSGGRVSVILRYVLTGAVSPVVSVTVICKPLKVPVVAGLPDSTPLLDSDNPAGRPVADHS